MALPAGTQIPYAYAAHDIEDQNTGFYDPGMGVVTADGLYIEYQLPHFSCMASTLPGPPDNPPETDEDDDDEEECDGGNCSVGISSGNLYIDYFLPSYKLLGRENSLTLLYNSDTVYKYIPVRIKAKTRRGLSKACCCYLLCIIWNRRWRNISRLLGRRCRAEIQCSNGGDKQQAIFNNRVYTIQTYLSRTNLMVYFTQQTPLAVLHLPRPMFHYQSLLSQRQRPARGCR